MNKTPMIDLNKVLLHMFQGKTDGWDYDQITAARDEISRLERDILFRQKERDAYSDKMRQLETLRVLTVLKALSEVTVCPSCSSRASQCKCGFTKGWIKAITKGEVMP